MDPLDEHSCSTHGPSPIRSCGGGVVVCLEQVVSWRTGDGATRWCTYAASTTCGRRVGGGLKWQQRSHHSHGSQITPPAWRGSGAAAVAVGGQAYEQARQKARRTVGAERGRQRAPAHGYDMMGAPRNWPFGFNFFVIRSFFLPHCSPAAATQSIPTIPRSPFLFA